MSGDVSDVSAQRKIWGPFSREELASFILELKSKFWGGVRSLTGVIYIAFTFVGIGLASFIIPSYNESEISPETLGIYVIGFLITVMLDAVLAWKKSGVDNENEQAIAGIFMMFSFLLLICTSLLSVKSFHLDTNKTRVGAWKGYAPFFLTVVFIVTIAMSLVLAGIDHELLKIGSLNKDVNDIRDR